MEEVDTENVVPMEGISLDNNPLEIVKSLRKNGILGSAARGQSGI